MLGTNVNLLCWDAQCKGMQAWPQVCSHSSSVFWASFPFISISGTECTEARVSSPISRKLKDDLAVSPQVACTVHYDLIFPSFSTCKECSCSLHSFYNIFHLLYSYMFYGFIFSTSEFCLCLTSDLFIYNLKLAYLMNFIHPVCFSCPV